MANMRRLTFNPPLTEAEFTEFCAANSGLKIDREPSGVIIVKRKGRGNYSDWLLSPPGTISSDSNLDNDERLSVGVDVHHIAQDNENLQALEALGGRLIRERDTSEGAHATALNVAIRALVSHIDILESLIAHEQGMPQKVTCRDMDTYDQRRKILNDAGQFVEKAVEGSGGDLANRNIVESVVAGLIIRATIADEWNQPALDLSDRDIQVLLEMIKNPPAPNKKLKEAVRRHQSGFADSRNSDEKSVPRSWTPSNIQALAEEIREQ
jgi:hypothetical protein